MLKLTHIRYSLLLLGCLLLATPQSFSASETVNRQQLFQMLKDGQHEAVRALDQGEREILLGKLALDAGNNNEAISFLNAPAAEKNPLAALIKAEAYRRQSVEAAVRAGSYAHAVDGDISKLKNAKLSFALKRADQRLLAFTESLNKPKHPAKVTVADHTTVTTTPARPDDINADIEQWRKDWESLNADAYLSHYHPAFKTAEYDYRSWGTYKRRVNGRKTYIRVAISNLNVLETARQTPYGEAVIVEFDQVYESSNYAASSRKRLSLVRNSNSGKWQILFEGDTNQPVSPVSNIPQDTNAEPVRAAATKTAAKWAINIAAFDSMANAEAMASEINVPPGEKQPFVSTIDNGEKLVHRVRIGLFDTRSEAVNTMLEACPALGLTDCWLEQIKE